MDFLNYIMDQLLETECKLGYSETAVHLNLPPRTVGGLLGNRDMPMDEAKAEAEAVFAKQEAFSDSAVLIREGMLVLSVGVRAIAFAHREYAAAHPEKAAFLASLVRAVMTPFSGRDEVHAVFAETGRPVVFENADNGEFDEIIRFTDADGEPIYCFEYGEERAEYHRLLPQDFAELYAENRCTGEQRENELPSK